MQVISFVDSVDCLRAGSDWTVFLILLMLFLLLHLIQFFTGHKFTSQPIEEVIDVKKGCLCLSLCLCFAFSFCLRLLFLIDLFLLFKDFSFLGIRLAINLRKFHLIHLILLFSLYEIIVEVADLLTVFIKKCIEAVLKQLLDGLALIYVFFLRYFNCIYYGCLWVIDQ